MLSLTDLPVELFLDNILPSLPLPDLLHLSSTNLFFASLVSDETFWHRKIQEDFNFSGSETARSSGWQFLYKRLYNPRVCVWGEASNGRLGARHVPQPPVGRGIPYPVHLKIPGVRIVTLVAAGMSFHALDAEGNIYVWGTLDGTNMALQSDGFSERCKMAERPMRLKLPVKFRSISCGRLHCSALDTASQVWTFTSWGQPFVLRSPSLDRSSPDTTPVQIECGWAFSSVLTQAADVLVFWPFSGQMHARITELSQDPSPAAKAKVNPLDPDVIPCYSWSVDDINPVRLPAIPAGRLPELAETGLSDEALREETKLVKIAGMDNAIIGLTNKGHVLRYGMLGGEDSYERGSWEFLAEFCDLTQVKAHPTFAAPPSSDRPDGGERPEAPTTMLITHISAEFQTFVAYSTGERSVVLMGKVSPDDPLAPLHPTILPALQNQNVISVVLGDYHYGALTAGGRLLTWGAFSHGALGLGDPLRVRVGAPGGFADARQLEAAARGGWLTPAEVRVPAEVRFDHGGRAPGTHYCFAAAAAGWHMGALVIDLEGDGGDEADAGDMPGAFPEPAPVPSTPLLRQGPGVMPVLPFGRGVNACGRRNGHGG